MGDVKSFNLPNHLPAIYHAEAEKEGSFLKAFLSIFNHFISGIENILEEIDTYFDPSLTPIYADKRGRDFLSWLASWVALRLDEGWSEQEKRYLIRNAAHLYRYRGTSQGLKHILSQFFDISVEVREWVWPQGMEIGRHSTIGVDSFLVERPNLDHCFTVIWKPSSRYIKSDFIKKIRFLIDLEKPAHTKCYFSLEFPEKELPELPALIIGISSIIGSCYLNQEVNHE